MNNQIILLLSVCIILFLCLIFHRNRQKKKPASNFSYDYSYMPYTKQHLLTRTEYAFYMILIEECNARNLLICPKVRLEDFIYVTDQKNRAKYRGYIKSRHVDFILTDQSLRLLAAIELDDPSHNTAHAMQVDEFKNRLFETIKLPLFRIRTDEDYKEALEELFEELGL